MSLSNKVRKDENTKDNTEEKKVQKDPITSDGAIHFELHEIEFLLKLIGNTNFQGKEVMTLYDIIAKIQNSYLIKKGK